MPHVTPQAWLDRVVSPSGPKPAPVRHLCLVLARHMIKGPSCFPSSRLLAIETGMSRNTVDRYLEAAVSQGWLTRRATPAPNDGRGWRGMEYTVALPDAGSTSEPAPLVVGGSEVGPRPKQERGAPVGPAWRPGDTPKVAQKVAQSGPEGGSTSEPEVKDEVLLKTPEASLPQASGEVQKTPPSTGSAERRGGFTPEELREALGVLKANCLLGRDRAKTTSGFWIALPDLRDQWTALAEQIGAEEATGVVALLRRLPIGHEDRPPEREVISLRWITKASAGRLERLRAELRRQTAPASPRSLGGLERVAVSIAS